MKVEEIYQQRSKSLKTMPLTVILFKYFSY